MRPGPLRTYLRRLAGKLDRDPVDAQLFLRNLRPWLSQEKPGVRLDQARAGAAIKRSRAAAARRSRCRP